MKYRWDVINFLIKKFNYQKYLEIGVDSGQCYNRIDIYDKSSVDPAGELYSNSKPVYKMTSDEFFKINSDVYDIIFIDGLHYSDQVDKDLQNSLNILSENGTIILHDVNPLNELAQRVTRESKSWNGDVWKSIVRHRLNNKEFGCISIDLLPTDEGISIIKKSINNPLTISVPDILSYEWLEKNRNEALGLVSINNFLTLI
jgi:hypothetical protein